jgi:hypothetical protein
MNSKHINWLILISAMALIGISLQSSSAQEPDDNPFAERREVRIDPRFVDLNSPPRLPDGTPVSITLWGGPDSKSAIRKAAEELRDAQGDEAKAKAEENLRLLLGDYFGEDMARREKELEAMQNRLKKLQEQLAKRRDKKREIVDLQIKVLTNEAEGLGFFSSNPEPNLFQRPQTFYSPRTSMPESTFLPPAQPEPPRTPATPIPSERQPSPPLEPSVAPESPRD